MKNKNITLMSALVMSLLSYMPVKGYATDKNKDRAEQSTSSQDDVEQISLGFDHYAYLPENFNPYSGMIFDIDAIEVEELEEEPVLEFDHYSYLPAGFNPYYGIELTLEDIVVIEEETEESFFDYDHKRFLPEGFNPYRGMLFEVDEIESIKLPYEEGDSKEVPSQEVAERQPLSK